MENAKLVGNGPVRVSAVETAGEYDVSDNFGFMLQQRVGGCVDMTLSLVTKLGFGLFY
jgi:hypothetical protein